MSEMSPEEFRSQGYLQEVNRIFFHPIGLALAVVYDGEEAVGMTVYETDDPEGWVFDPSVQLNSDLAETIQRRRSNMMATRKDNLGFWIQPVE